MGPGSYRQAAPWYLAVAATAAGDALAHRLRRPHARAAARYTAAAAVLMTARAAGASRPALGLGWAELRPGLRTGAAGSAAVAALVFTAAALPATRGFFRDERAAATAAAGYRGLAAELARITLATVPPEELAYRSGLLGLRLASGSRAGAVAWPSLIFGLSHVVPTVSAMRHTALHRQLAGHPLRQAAFVAANVTATGLAGAVFAWLRLRSGSVAAPLLAHVTLNNSAMLAGWAVQARGQARDHEGDV
jgi:CAAX protease family protein